MSSRIDKSDRGLVAAIFRYKWLIAALTVAACAGAVGLALTQPRLYEAKASVLLSLRQPDPEIQGGQGALPTGDQATRYVSTQALVARAPALIDGVLRDAGRTDLTTRAFLDHSTVSADPNADVLTFAVSDSRGPAAADLANRYATAFADYRERLDTQAFESALSGVRSRIDLLEAEVDAAIRSGQTRAGDAGDEAGSASRELETLRAREQDLQTAAALRSDAVTVQSLADSSRQVQPRPIRDGVLGLLLGLLAGVALAIGIDAVDRRPRNPGEVRDALDTPVLAYVPVRRWKRRAPALPVLHSPTSAEAESYRKLRAALQLATSDDARGIVMLSSATKASAKSTTAANLAVAYARAGSNVILVDADLRRPALSTLFRIDSSPGLVDVLHGHALPGEVLHEIDLDRAPRSESSNDVPATVGSLFVLPSGPLPTNPADVAASGTFAALLDEVRSMADVVFVDTPPMLPVSDAVSLSRHVDGLVAVISWGVDDRETLRAYGDALATLPARVIGAVVVGGDEVTRTPATATEYRSARQAAKRSSRPSQGRASADGGRPTPSMPPADPRMSNMGFALRDPTR